MLKISFEVYFMNIDFFKGLVAVGERAQKRSGNFSAAMKDLSGEGTLGFFSPILTFNS